jgi:hypothetical protein
MKFKYLVVVDIPDSELAKFAEECDAPLYAYQDGTRESLREEIEEMMDENGYTTTVTKQD